MKSGIKKYEVKTKSILKSKYNINLTHMILFVKFYKKQPILSTQKWVTESRPTQLITPYIYTFKFMLSKFKNILKKCDGKNFCNSEILNILG